MATDLQTQPFTIQAITYDVPHAVIEQLAERYLPLKIKSINDKSGLRRVQAGREALHELTRKIEKRRKELKADSLDYGRKVDEAARELQSLIEPIAGHLQQLEHDNARERTRLERDAAGQRVAVIRERLGLLAECGWNHYTPAGVGWLSVEQFDELLGKARSQRRATSKPTAPKPTPAVGADLSLKAAAEVSGLLRRTDIRNLLNVADAVAGMSIPPMQSIMAAAAAREVATLLANCAERIRAAANLIAK